MHEPHPVNVLYMVMYMQRHTHSLSLTQWKLSSACYACMHRDKRQGVESGGVIRAIRHVPIGSNTLCIRVHSHMESGRTWYPKSLSSGAHYRRTWVKRTIRRSIESEGETKIPIPFRLGKVTWTCHSMSRPFLLDFVLRGKVVNRATTTT